MRDLGKAKRTLFFPTRQEAANLVDARPQEPPFSVEVQTGFDVGYWDILTSVVQNIKITR